jgi:hypothetical protein
VAYDAFEKYYGWGGNDFPESKLVYNKIREMAKIAYKDSGKTRKGKTKSPPAEARGLLL